MATERGDEFERATWQVMVAATVAGDKAARIWYATLRDDRLGVTARFKEFALLTYINAWNLFPAGDEAEIVGNAWEQVGIEISQ